MAPDVPLDARADSQPDAASDPTADNVEAMCVQPKANCTPQNAGSLCDPYCQSGCTGCAQRCSVNTVGALTCLASLAAGNLGVGVSCDIASAGGPNQTDACAPGSVCLHDCGMHCYRFCRTDADCPTSSCSRPVIPGGNTGGYMVCELPFSACDPLNPRTSCPFSSQSCYLSPVMPDKAFCDCPAGDKRESEPCSVPTDCLPGLTCVDASNSGDFRCRSNCGLTVQSPCNGAATCKPINGSKTYGFCL